MLQVEANSQQPRTNNPNPVQPKPVIGDRVRRKQREIIRAPVAIAETFGNLDLNGLIRFNHRFSKLLIYGASNNEYKVLIMNSELPSHELRVTSNKSKMVFTDLLVSLEYTNLLALTSFIHICFLTMFLWKLKKYKKVQDEK